MISHKCSISYPFLKIFLKNEYTQRTYICHPSKNILKRFLRLQDIKIWWTLYFEFVLLKPFHYCATFLIRNNLRGEPDVSQNRRPVKVAEHIDIGNLFNCLFDNPAFIAYSNSYDVPYNSDERGRGGGGVGFPCTVPFSYLIKKQATHYPFSWLNIVCTW